MKITGTLLFLLLSCCVIVAQNKPTETKPGKSAAAITRELQGVTGSPSDAKKPDPMAAEVVVKQIINGDSRKRVEPINVRDELIELVHQLKKDAAFTIKGQSAYDSNITNSVQSALSARHDTDTKAKIETQRLLLHALTELSKEAAKDKPTKVWHSSQPPEPGEGKWWNQ